MLKAILSSQSHYHAGYSGRVLRFLVSISNSKYIGTLPRTRPTTLPPQYTATAAAHPTLQQHRATNLVRRLCFFILLGPG